jgi:hypothetical protein
MSDSKSDASSADAHKSTTKKMLFVCNGNTGLEDV